MKSFVYLISPGSIAKLKGFWPLLKVIPESLIRQFAHKAFPIKTLYFKNIRLPGNKSIQGYIAVLPFMEKENQQANFEIISRKIKEVAELSLRLNAGILGLDGRIASIIEKNSEIFYKSRIPITGGSSLVSWSIFEAIYRMSRLKNFNLNSSSIALLDATTSIGNLCSRKLSYYVNELLLIDSDINKLNILRETILYLNNHIKIDIATDTDKADGSDIVIYASRSSCNKIGINKIRPKIASFADYSLQSESCETVKTGLIKMPFPDINLDSGMQKGVIDASLAETMLLAAAGKFESYSLGENINLDKMEEIADITVRNGFEVWLPEAPII